MRYILALDQGTTSSRAILFDRDGAIAAVAQKEFRQIFPQPGLGRARPERDLGDADRRRGRGARPRAASTATDVAAIGITNQRETTVVWDRETGSPVHNAIVWQDRRTAEFCDRLKADGHEPLIRERTGLRDRRLLLRHQGRWLLDNVPGARDARRSGRARLRHDRLLAGLEADRRRGARHRRRRNASRTMLFNIHTLRVGRRAAAAARRAAQHAARGAVVERGLRRVTADARARRRADRRHRRRPAGGAVRPDLHVARAWPRTPTAPAASCCMNTGTKPVASTQPAAHDRRLADRRPHRVRARRQRLHRRRRGAVAARRPRASSSARRTSRGARRQRAGQRRRLSRAGVRRPRRAALGPVRARHDRRHHARHDRGAHRARGAREHRLPGRRPARRDAARRRHPARRSCASTAARRATTC